MKIDMKKKKIIAIAILAVSVILAVVGFLILPDTLIIQLSIDGTAGNTAPKVLGLLLPVALSGFGSIGYGKSGSGKMLLTACVGLVAFLLLFVFNL